MPRVLIFYVLQVLWPPRLTHYAFMGVYVYACVRLRRSVRVLRVLRPLRLINKIPSLQILLKSIANSVEDVVRLEILALYRHEP
jgi:hypothetical protein